MSVRVFRLRQTEFSLNLFRVSLDYIVPLVPGPLETFGSFNKAQIEDRLWAF